MVDCRKCIYFKPCSKMMDNEIAGAIEWINRYKPGESLKGYCTYYDMPITRYKGKCRAYKPRIITSQSLKKWIPGL